MSAAEDLANITALFHKSMNSALRAEAYVQKSKSLDNPCGNIVAESQGTLLGNGTTNVSLWQCNNRGISGSSIFYAV
jgi:hypothetical protein